MKLADFSALAGLDLPKSSRSFGRGSSLVLRDVVLIVGLAVALVIVLAVAIYIWYRWRQRRKRHVSGGEKVYRRGSSTESQESEETLAEDDEESDSEQPHSHHGRRRYKYRVRRRTHRSRNPTLSETGGLPPARTREPSQPC